MKKELKYKAQEMESYNQSTMTEKDIFQLLEKVPPLWDLESYIAVNPFLGYTNQPFEIAMEHLENVLDTELIPSQDLLEMNKVPTPPKRKESSYRIESLLGGFLSSYTDKGISFWANPWKDKPLWVAFKNWARRDPLFLSLTDKTTRKDLALLSDKGGEALIQLTGAHDKLSSRSIEYLLFLLPGWASYFRKKNWHDPMDSDSDLPGFLGILAFLYIYVPSLFPEKGSSSPRGDKQSRLDRLKAKEREYRDELLAKISENHKSSQEETLKSSTSEKAKVRFLFCIDVRSESFRRHLESTSSEIETDGFAGFFGMPIGYKYWTDEEFSHAPALIQPSFVFRDNRIDSKRKLLQTKSWIQKIKRTFPIGFQYVEGAGFLSAFGLLAKTIKKVTNNNSFRDLSDEDISQALESLDKSTQEAIALGVLKHLGWTENFPEYIVITGHGSHTQNNPHEAGLSCGACAGQSGELSARFACALYNLPSVREYLKSENILIPDSTRFIPAMHETVTDEIILYRESDIDKEYLPILKSRIETARNAYRIEKYKTLGLNPQSAVQRSKDWAEVFPEAGLAGCAGFIIGRRELTKGLDLKGRTFLNSYDYKKDKDLGTLELLLTAPMVVASWINLQYYASTVSPEDFGAGNKLLHSITGNMGVVEGNSWNLKTGLPLQSVYDGERFIHQPIRLQVIVESPIENIEKILDRHPNVNQLVEGEWVHLIVADPDKGFMMKNGKEWKVYS